MNSASIVLRVLIPHISDYRTLTFVGGLKKGMVFPAQVEVLGSTGLMLDN